MPLNFSEKHNNLSGCRCSWSWIRSLPAKQVQGFLLYFHFCVSSPPRPCLVLAYPQLVMDATWLRLAFANYWLPFLKSSNLHAFRENFVLMDKGPLLSVLECACVRARISVEALPGDEFIPCMHRNESTHASTSNASGFCVHAPLLNPVSNIVTWFSSCCSSVIYCICCFHLLMRTIILSSLPWFATWFFIVLGWSELCISLCLV